MARTFRLWALSDTHVGTEIKFGRRSLEEVIQHAEAWPNAGGQSGGFDIAVNLGDFSGSQLPPDDEEGELVVSQYASAKKHRREHFYDVIGNHDASGVDEPTQWWFQKWIDPTGESTEHSGIDNSKRPYPTTGTWENYSFEIGNVVFLMMADRNDGGAPIG
ncbi:MAG: metallophosphoesterase, partial [Chloroflexi bacterium]|nr:metallophosphoesterase [Chloroflexota bacterium]